MFTNLANELGPHHSPISSPFRASPKKPAPRVAVHWWRPRERGMKLDQNSSAEPGLFVGVRSMLGTDLIIKKWGINYDQPAKMGVLTSNNGDSSMTILMKTHGFTKKMVGQISKPPGWMEHMLTAGSVHQHDGQKGNFHQSHLNISGWRVGMLTLFGSWFIIEILRFDGSHFP